MTNLDLQGLSRDELAAALREQFPHLSAADTAVSPTVGGRVAAQAALVQIDPSAYERSRNFLTGDVTRLSAYLRHGVLTLAEVRDAALDRVREPKQASKLINELAWRDYWQRLYVQLGEGIWKDREAYKTGYRPSDYATSLPDDISAGSTTLVCMDSFAQHLVETGYLHNHARMWMAAYLVHWRHVAWQAGARWFLEHLVDGDPASNNLSWQWVASTFAAKAYFFNRENLERYTGGVFCRTCPHARARTCPFEQDYDGLTLQLFPHLNDPLDRNTLPPAPRPFAPAPASQPAAPAKSQKSGTPLLWIHTDSLDPASPMLAEHRDHPAVFLWDMEWLTSSNISLKRLIFLAECLREMPMKIELRTVPPKTPLAEELLAAARNSGAGYVLAQRTPDPRLLAAAAAVERQMPVVWYDPPAFAAASRGYDLKRFSRYWQSAQHSALLRTRE